jgi:hypothetical protein
VDDPDAGHDLRVAEDGGRAGEVIEEPDSGTEENRSDVDLDLVVVAE